MEKILRKREVKERGLPFFVLTARREHVVGHAGGLGHRHIDHDQQLQFLECLAHGTAVRDRHHRVPTIDE